MNMTILCLDIVFLTVMAIASAAYLDPRVISITTANGQVIENPTANYGVSNTACTDTFSRLKDVCSAFCSTTAKVNYANRKNYHLYSLSHFDLTKNYPRWDGWNMTSLKAYIYDEYWSDFYKKQSDSCKLCQGLGAFSWYEGSVQVIR